MTRERSTGSTLPGNAAAREALRHQFLGWQCRLRQLAVREDGGRPGTGMRPAVRLAGEPRPLGPITVLLVPLDPAAITAEFQYLMRKERDPAQRHEAALGRLAAEHYQHPTAFSDRLTALFGPRADLADRLLDAGACTLDFEQFSQAFTLPCEVADLPEAHPAHQATYWHNHLFNPAMPPGVRVLQFTPDWDRASASP